MNVDRWCSREAFDKADFDTIADAQGGHCRRPALKNVLVSEVGRHHGSAVLLAQSLVLTKDELVSTSTHHVTSIRTLPGRASSTR